jgi:serine protease Do
MERLNLPAAVLAAFLLVVGAPQARSGTTDQDLSGLVASLLPSCVNITTTRYQEVKIVDGKSVIVQHAEADKRRAYGSGFIIRADGYVLTNKHVTRNGISYSVTLADGRQFPADLVAQAVANDIAILRIRSNETWTPVKFGDSDTLRRGDAVIAIGNPIDWQSTVTSGVVSALNRDLGYTEFDDYIQTDAAINEGNSGGPLFNLKGEVIGVNTALFTVSGSSGSIGIGLAIPINDAEFVLRHMAGSPEATLNWRPAYLGASIQSLTPKLAAAYGLPDPWASIIARVDDNSPAAAAKLRAGDIITSMDGKDRRDSRALMRAIIETPAGTTARLGVWRNGKQEVVPVALAALPAGWTLPEYLSGGGVAKPDLPPEALVNFGLQLSAITPELRAQYKLAATQPGVLVTGVAIGSEAANIGIDAGAVIVRVRDATVATPEDLVQRVADERQQNRAFMPVLLFSNGGLSWVSFRVSGRVGD